MNCWKAALGVAIGGLAFAGSVEAQGIVGPRLFDYAVTCAAPANHFDRYNSAVLSNKASTPGAIIVGHLTLSKAEGGRYAPSIGVLAAGEIEGPYTKIGLKPCGEQKVCLFVDQIAVDKSGKAASVSLPAPSLTYAIGEAVPVRIEVVSRREWKVVVGGNIIRVPLSHDVNTLAVSCVGAAGVASFESAAEPIS